MTPAVANGQPAAVTYHRDADGVYHAFGLALLTVTPAGITRITVFGGGPGLVAKFGLPSTLVPQSGC
jgi:RNA polymerase sigma-70 factor, ECF subfamily